MKRFPLILLVLAMFSDATAQQESGSLRLGILAGLNNNKSSETVALQEYIGYAADYDQINYRVGLNLEYEFRSNLAINTGLKYSNMDFTGTYYCMVCDFSSPPTPQIKKLRFVEVPLTLRYYLLPQNFRIFGEAGITNLFPLDTDLTDQQHVLGMQLGGGAEYNFPSGIAIQLFLDYSKNLSGIFPESETKLEVLGLGISILKRL